MVERVDFITGAGYLDGAHARDQVGLATNGPRLLVTNLGVMGCNAAAKRMQLEFYILALAWITYGSRLALPCSCPTRPHAPCRLPLRNSPYCAIKWIRKGFCCHDNPGGRDLSAKKQRLPQRSR